MPVKMKTKGKGQKRSKPTTKVETPLTAEEKRLQSIALKKKEYKSNVSAIQAALANVDTKSNNKIVFDDEGDAPQHVQVNNVTKELSTKKSLFDDDDPEDDYENEPNFEIKEQFQGKKGKKLMELQSKFKNDKRFMLDERFIEEDKEMNEVENVETMDVDDEDLTKEKEQEFAILEQVLGKKIVKQSDRKKFDKKAMLRYDPSQPYHSKFEVKESEIIRKEEITDDSKKLKNDLIVEEEPKPEVSKDTFYQVTDGLKDALQAGQSYSLLNMFGRPKVADTEKVEERPVEIKKGIAKDFTPFPYDSSGESELSEADDFVEESNVINEVEAEVLEDEEPKPVESARSSLWTESLFFKTDDYRLQEGVNFLKKFEEAEEPKMFTKIRRDIMEIVRAKVRHNKRKEAPFKKKLGGKKKNRKGRKR